MIEGRKASYHADDFVVPFKTVHKIAKETVEAKSHGAQVPVTEGYWLDTIPFVIVPRS